MKHTPGPWELTTANADTYKSLNYGVKGPEINGSLDFTICDMCDDGYDDETQKANAHLIAAAPDLLEALENIVALSEGSDRLDWPEYIEAQKAIKKAKL